MRCNICGGDMFEPFRGRANERCTTCGAKARHRVALDVYERFLFPLAGDGLRILHLAPEECLFPLLRVKFGDGYKPADAVPDRYPWAKPRKLVLPGDFDAFPRTISTASCTTTCWSTFPAISAIICGGLPNG